MSESRDDEKRMTLKSRPDLGTAKQPPEQLKKLHSVMRIILAGTRPSEFAASTLKPKNIPKHNSGVG